jgi:hypothetical protein
MQSQFMSGTQPGLNMDALSFQQMMNFLNSNQMDMETLQRQVANAPMSIN